MRLMKLKTENGEVIINLDAIAYIVPLTTFKYNICLVTCDEFIVIDEQDQIDKLLILNEQTN
jgi:hypothetical protein